MGILPRFAQSTNTNRQENQSVTKSVCTTVVTALYLQGTRVARNAARPVYVYGPAYAFDAPGTSQPQTGTARIDVAQMRAIEAGVREISAEATRSRIRHWHLPRCGARIARRRNDSSSFASSTLSSSAYNNQPCVNFRYVSARAISATCPYGRFPDNLRGA
jgi:hypothetical protein